MKLPLGVSILISNDINTLIEKEFLFLNLGGNKKLYEFIYTILFMLVFLLLSLSSFLFIILLFFYFYS